ncbi:hypothetical protein KM043_012959 [Ampulex compressa]|nr:hypothetical protein KM043_012959 [Ampulex compressa]
MINIDHPKVYGKPPAKKHASAKLNEENDDFDKAIASDTAEMSMRIESERNDAVVAMHADMCIEDSKMKMQDFVHNDYNQNIIESKQCPFEQLCNMINNLEQNIATEISALEPEKDYSGEQCKLSATTYEDIMSFLEKLEDGSIGEMNANQVDLNASIIPEFIPTDQYSLSINRSRFDKIKRPVSETFQEDLAMAKLQIEEKDATITLLRDQLKTERKSACEKLNAQEKNHDSTMKTQEEKYKGIIKRHQKFIEKLLGEKTDLTEKCNSLAQQIREMEIKAQRDLKVASDRHLVELQRARDHYAAAEKIRRERWLEARTIKIKEMTVKGLEPELRSMVDRHQQEVQEIRSAHIKELQDAELRLIRRSNQQLEELRLELTASHEKILANEKDILSQRYREKIGEQQSQFQAERQRFMEDLQKEKIMLSQERARCNEEKDQIVQQARDRMQQEIEAFTLQHLAEKKTFEESLRLEWQTWLADYKRQQLARLEREENKIREESRRERDRQIELAIERLERDSRETRAAVQQDFDFKLKSIKERYEADLQTALNNEKTCKNKLSVMEERTKNAEMQLQKLENHLQECTSNLNNANKTIEKLIKEKNNAKSIARQEIETEKRGLEDKIASLYKEITQNNANRDTLMVQLHSRIKLIVMQKILTIKNLNKELDELKAKCEHLEKLLDQQRKEYILKSL